MLWWIAKGNVLKCYAKCYVFSSIVTCIEVCYFILSDVMVLLLIKLWFASPHVVEPINYCLWGLILHKSLLWSKRDFIVPEG